MILTQQGETLVRMLTVLPRLPQDVWYRFLDRDLILHDSRANVILDRIEEAVRCPAQFAD